MVESHEVTQALAIACLSQSEFIEKLASTPVKTLAETKDARFYGTKVGEFYQAIYKAVLEAPSKAAEDSKS